MERRKFPVLLVSLAVCFTVFLAGLFFGRRMGRQDFDWTFGDEIPASTTQATEEAVQDGKLNVNEASAQELAELPGIGTVLAERIVEYRTAYGPFQSLEELCGVDGIGEKRLEDLQDYAAVR